MAQRTVSVVLSAEVMGYEQAMGRASRATSSVADAGDKANGRLKKAFDTSAKVAGTMFNAALVGGAALVTNLATVGVSYNSLQQNSRAALETILGSTEAVNEQMAALDDLVSRSPFGKDVFISAQQQMLAFGIETQKVVPYLDAVQNAVAATGGSSQKLAEITYVMAQIQSAGKVTATDLMQMGQRGVDAATLVGSQMGKTSGEIREMITKGEIDVETFLDSLTAGMSEKFGGATDAIKRQWTGAQDRLKAGWREIGSAMVEPFISKQGGGMAVTWANDVADALGEAKKKAGPFTDVIVGRLMPALDRITPAIQGIRTAIAGTSTRDLEVGLDRVAQNAVPLAGVAGYLAAMGTQWPILQKLGLSLNPVVGAMIGITAASPAMRSAVSSTWDALKPGIEIGREVVSSLMGIVDEVVTEAAPGFAAFGEGAAKVVVSLADVVSAAMPVVGALVPVVGVVADLVGVVASLPGPVLLGVAALVALRGPAGALGGVLTSAATGMSAFWAASKQVSFGAGVPPVMASIRAGAAGAGSALKGAGSALLGAFGGPAGVAVAAGAAVIVAGIAGVSEAQRHAKQTAEDYRSSLDQLTGAWTESTDAMVADKIIETGWADKIEAFGGDLKTALDVVKGVNGAKDDLQAQMRAAYAADDSINVQDYMDFVVWASAQGHVADEAADAIRQKAAMTREDTAASAAAAEGYDAAGSAVERWTAALKGLADMQAGQGKSMQDFYDAQSRLNEVLSTANETIAANTEAGKDQWSTLSGIKDSMDGYIDNMIAATDANGNAKFTMGEVSAEASRLAESWIALADQAGYTAPEARALAEELGLLDRDIETRYRLADEDRSKVDEIRAELDGLPSEVVTTLLARDDASEVADAAANAIREGMPPERLTVLLAEDQAYPGVVKPLVQRLQDEYERDRTTLLKADNKTAPGVDAANKSLASVKDKSVNLTAQDNISSKVISIQSMINSLTGKTITLTTNHNINTVYSSSGGMVASGSYEGGFLPGLNQGGWVPGQRAGYDNVLWPRRSPAGGLLMQPLEGTEFVVRSSQAQKHAALLEAINSGSFAPGMYAGGSLSRSSVGGPSVVVSAPEVHVTAVVENPWTGEEVEARVARTVVRYV